MSTKTTYILFGSTNGYQASRNATFKGRTRIAHNCEVNVTAEEASRKLMSYYEAENDNYTTNDAGDVVFAIGYNEETEQSTYETLGSVGDLSYSDDGYSWEFIALEDLTEEDARLALKDGRLIPSDEEAIYELHPDLRPSEEEED